MNTELTQPNEDNKEIATVRLKSNDLVSLSLSHEISDDASLTTAGLLLIQLNETKTAIEGLWKEVVKAAHDSHKTAVKQRNDMLEPVKNAMKELKVSLDTYRDNQYMTKEEEEARCELELNGGSQSESSVEDDIFELSNFKPDSEPVPQVAGIEYRRRWKARIRHLPTFLTFLVSLARVEDGLKPSPEFEGFKLPSLNGQRLTVESLVSPNMVTLNKLAKSHKEFLEKAFPGVVSEMVTKSALGRKQK